MKPGIDVTTFSMYSAATRSRGTSVPVTTWVMPLSQNSRTVASGVATKCPIAGKPVSHANGWGLLITTRGRRSPAAAAASTSRTSSRNSGAPWKLGRGGKFTTWNAAPTTSRAAATARARRRCAAVIDVVHARLRSAPIASQTMSSG